MVRFVQLLIRFYQLTFSALIGRHCRFAPSCSQYCHEALELHGFFKGLSLGVKRISRCHPWGGSGFDPVPDEIEPKKLHEPQNTDTEKQKMENKY